MKENRTKRLCDLSKKVFEALEGYTISESLEVLEGAVFLIRHKNQNGEKNTKWKTNKNKTNKTRHKPCKTK